MNPLAAEKIGEENKSNQISESWLFQYLKKRKKNTPIQHNRNNL